MFSGLFTEARKLRTYLAIKRNQQGDQKPRLRMAEQKASIGGPEGGLSPESCSGTFFVSES